jgi:hypothetical protein
MEKKTLNQTILRVLGNILILHGCNSSMLKILMTWDIEQPAEETLHDIQRIAMLTEDQIKTKIVKLTNSLKEQYTIKIKVS